MPCRLFYFSARLKSPVPDRLARRRVLRVSFALEIPTFFIAVIVARLLPFLHLAATFSPSILADGTQPLRPTFKSIERIAPSR